MSDDDEISIRRIIFSKLELDFYGRLKALTARLVNLAGNSIPLCTAVRFGPGSEQLF